MANERNVGFMGLGGMGSAMAANIQQALSQGLPGWGRSLHLYNRSPDKATPLVEQGATHAASPADLAAACSVVFSMMANDSALRSVFDAYWAGNPQPGSIFVDCSTVYPALVKELANKAAFKGVIFLSCQVFGRPDAARAKKLIVLAAGDSDAKEKVRPLLESMGRLIIDAGSKPAQAAATKLMGNFMISGFIELASEAFVLAEKSGVDRSVTHVVMNELFASPIPQGYVSNIAADSFQFDPSKPGFAVELAKKDVGHMVQLAREGGAPLPIADLALAHLRAVEERGGGGLDWSAMALGARVDAGLRIPEGLLRE